MKNLFIILLSMLSVVGLSAQAQTKKPAPKTTTTKTTSTTKKTPAKTATTTKTTTTKAVPAKTAATSTPAKTEEKVAAKPSTSVAKQTKPSTGSSSYKSAVGLKFIYGISLTGKTFLNDKAALEGILRYTGGGGLSNFAFTGLYEHHTDIKSVEGLRWYVGGGGQVIYYSGGGGSDVSFGVSGILGLEYKIKNLPLAISADWQPTYMISPASVFSAENGGIGVKYTF
jgi:hypothetical protein